MTRLPSMRPGAWAGWLTITLLCWSPAGTAADEGRAQAAPVTVFAAASLTDALSEIGDAYHAMGHDLRFSFAASSTLARQIEAGAPADIFASASERWMDYLQERHLIDAASRIEPIGNNLVLVAPADPAPPALQLDQRATLEPLLGTAGRLAMGDPAHVPAGIYAQQSLQALGWWQGLQSRLAFANDVRGVLALVERGEAPLGIVYSTDAAISKRVAVLATLPASSHAPIRYSIALLADRDNPAAAHALAFMTGPTAMAIFHHHGFLVP